MRLAEEIAVKNWTLEQYLRLKFEGDQAFTVEQAETLMERGVDYHMAARFLANGCTPELVVAILV